MRNALAMRSTLGMMSMAAVRSLAGSQDQPIVGKGLQIEGHAI